MISGFSSSTLSYGGYFDKALQPEREKFDASASDKPKSEKKPGNPNELSNAEKEQVEKLKKRDAEVKAHEMAHMAAAGSLARGGPSYEYQLGPDGKNYAIGGHVNIDTSPGNTPEETKRKAAQIRASALAPSDPSAQDIKVAAAASSMALQANAKEGSEEKKVDESGAKPETSDSQDPNSEIDGENGPESKAPDSRFQNALSAYQKAGNSPREAIYNFEA